MNTGVYASAVPYFEGCAQCENTESMIIINIRHAALMRRRLTCRHCPSYLPTQPIHALQLSGALFWWDAILLLPACKGRRHHHVAFGYHLVWNSDNYLVVRGG